MEEFSFKLTETRLLSVASLYDIQWVYQVTKIKRISCNYFQLVLYPPLWLVLGVSSLKKWRFQVEFVWSVDRLASRARAAADQ
jgi:hypothetical protein